MKKYITVVLLLIIVSTAFCQNEFTFTGVTVVRMKNGSAFLEFTGNPQERIDFDKLGKYWITPTSNIALQNALTKAKKWANLNQTQKADFAKEILRIRVTDKDTYLSFKHYISQFTSEAKLIFYGSPDGNFKCKFTFETQGGNFDYTFSTTDDLDDMIDLLKGKSIDDNDKIFN